MTKNFPFLKKHKHLFYYGFILALLLYILKWLEYKLLIYHHAFEIYIGIIALLFMGLGIWLTLKLSRPKVKTIVVEKEVWIPAEDSFIPNQIAIEKTNLSPRELEILQLLAKGLRNEDIANQLFVSLSTIKTHNQNIYSKLEVKSRTQAIDKGKRLQIIA